MNKIFAASLLLISLTSGTLKAGIPPIPDPTRLPLSVIDHTSDSNDSMLTPIQAYIPPIPDPTKLPL